MIFDKNRKIAMKTLFSFAFVIKKRRTIVVNFISFEKMNASFFSKRNRKTKFVDKADFAFAIVQIVNFWNVSHELKFRTKRDFDFYDYIFIDFDWKWKIDEAVDKRWTTRTQSFFFVEHVVEKQKLAFVAVYVRKIIKNTLLLCSCFCFSEKTFVFVNK